MSEPSSDYSYLDDPAEREWLVTVSSADVLANAPAATQGEA